MSCFSPIYEELAEVAAHHAAEVDDLRGGKEGNDLGGVERMLFGSAHDK